MDRSEGNDDELYPAAPVPAHERPWRHPSEVGQQTWVATEPPLTIGRGLSAATGVIGGVLALAVLWTMLPTHAGRSAGVTVRSTVATSASLGNGSTVPATVSPAPDTTTGGAPTTTIADTTTSVPNASPTTAGEPPTTRPEPLPTYAVTLGTSVEPVAVAVAVNHGALVITTASAVRDDNTVALRLPDGSVETAEVLLVDERSGFAVLAHDASTSMASFTVATEVQPGEELSFYGGDSATAIVSDDGVISVAPTSTDPGTESTGPPDTPLDDLPEGTPVVNGRGELVALCSHRDGVASLVSLEHLDSLRKALANDAAGRVWMGVMLRDGDTDATGVTVDSVTAGGPAAEGGLLAGDVITSLDDQPVVDATSIGAALAGYEPGDAITLAVVRDGQQLTIGVTLAAPRANL